MKKIFKSSLCALLFALAFLFSGITSVRAEETGSIDNTEIAFVGQGVSFMSLEKNYYIINDVDGAANIEFSAKSAYKNVTFFPVVYNAKFAIVNCKSVDSSNVCRTWNVYEYSADDNETMDALKAGLVVDLNTIEFAEMSDVTEVAGKSLGTLDSIYGLDGTYFALVQYKSGVWYSKDVYETEVYRLVLANSLDKISVNKTDISTGTRVTITSGAPINTIRYFATANNLQEGFNFSQEFNANQGRSVLNSAPANQISNNGVFTYEFEIATEEGKNYYIEITDLASNKTVYDMAANQQQDENVPGSSDTNNSKGSNVGDTDIGKIILVSLIIVLVVSVVLVIIQKIVDYKKRLY